MDTFPNNKQIVGSHSCGPVSVQNIYTHFQKSVSLETILQELNVLSSDNTYTPQLGRNCLVHGLQAVMVSSNAFSIAPNWKGKTKEELITLLKTWLAHNTTDVWVKETLFLLFFLEEGGSIDICDLSTGVLDSYLDQGHVLLTALEESWLWGKRKIAEKTEYDDIKGHTRGHFIVIYGKEGDEYLVSDPYPTGIPSREGLYRVNKQQLLVAILIWSHEVLAVKTP